MTRTHEHPLDDTACGAQRSAADAPGGLRPAATTPLWMKETISAPIAPPTMVPVPPQVGVPPTNTEVIAGTR